MRHTSRFLAIGLVLAGSCRTGSSGGPDTTTTGDRPAVVANTRIRGVERKPALPKPDIRLTTVDGSPFSLLEDTRGYLTLLFFGYIGVGLDPDSPWREIVAVFFGIGMGLTLDEFALWLNLRDVYWEKEGRRSIDAVMVTAGIALLLLVGFRGWVDAADSVENEVFALAGGAAGVVSGLVRREVQGAVVGAGGLAGAVFLGGIHWLALHEWRRLRSWTMR